MTIHREPGEMSMGLGDDPPDQPGPAQDAAAGARRGTDPSAVSAGPGDAPFPRAGEEVVSNEETTRVPRYEEQLQASKALEEVGQIRITKEIVEEEQALVVPVLREEVHVRKRAVDRPLDDASQAFQQQTIIVPIREERIELRKEPRVVEELEITKIAAQTEERVSGIVRKERLRVQEEGRVERERTRRAR